jgi:hypothetical protein
MAAKKSTRKKTAAHAGRTEALKLPTIGSQRRTHVTARPSVGCSHHRAVLANADRPVRDRTELIERLSNALALIETVAMALREFEPNPVLGSICMALDQAVVVVGQAHVEVAHFLDKVQS